VDTNGGDFQGIGIIPDVKVTRTVKGVIEEKDEILEKAIEIMKKNGN
jgi:C-terminal processing protease CtpA/Prc